MRNEKPNIAIIFSDEMPIEFLDEFRLDVAAKNLRLELVPVPLPKAYAAIEWLMPTVIFAFVAKSYFDGFLGEAGKDHYQILRRALIKLAKRLAPVRITLVGSSGKLSKEQKYSLTYSIVGELNSRTQIKLLLKSDLNDGEIEEAISAFLALLGELYSNQLEPAVQNSLKTAKIPGGTLLVAYNPDTKELEVIDPRPDSDAKEP
jgi:hypothetical protein